jgi:hypothetical protein
MGLQPFNGNEIAIELIAAEDIPPYSLIMFDATDKTKCRKCTAGSIPIAVAIPPEDMMMSDGSGGIVKRTGWKTGETVTAFDSGTVYVVLGGTVTAGQECIPGSTAGKGYGQAKPALTAPTLTAKVAADFIDLALGATPTGTEINTAVNALIDEIIVEANQTITEVAAGFTSVLASINARKTVFGEYLVGGDANDIVPMKIR